MKQRLESAVYDFLKGRLSEDIAAMLVKGHSTELRPLPYICVYCGEQTPFGLVDGMFAIPLSISLADSASDIDYTVQAARRNAVEDAMLDFGDAGDFRIYDISLEENTDAKDSEKNNLGDVLSYAVIAQEI